MKNMFLSALALILSINMLYSQSYDIAAGIRLGTDIGVSAKVRIPPVDENFTAEMIIQSSLKESEGLFTILGEQHIPLITRRLSLYAGGGVHMGWLEDNPNRDPSYKAPKGISLIGGAEINFRRINISTDFKPAINLSGGSKVMYTQTAVTLRYIPFQRYDIFNSPRQKRKKQRQQNRKKRQSSGKKKWEFWKT